MANWGSWLALIGGVLSVIAEFTTASWYGALIGGLLAIIGAIGMMSSK